MILAVVLSLQWGRNFFVTEICHCQSVWNTDLGFNGAVTFSLRKFGLSLYPFKRKTSLQWGRNFFVTEILVHLQYLTWQACGFNGAVTFSLRKSHTTPATISAHGKLQWGRNFFVTEIGFHLSKTPLMIGASMGP